MLVTFWLITGSDIRYFTGEYFCTFVQMANMIWSTPKSRHAKAAWSLKLVKADDFRVAHDSKLEWTYNSDRNGTPNAAYEQFYSWSNAWTYIYFAYFYHRFGPYHTSNCINFRGFRHNFTWYASLVTGFLIEWISNIRVSINQPSFEKLFTVSFFFVCRNSSGWS